ncbi:hypothetical protein E2C01_079601 [Portunus trituberculatus]|uniref:Uncharacterized protein n=1 Tax=Portunus trituberculatus TaxID=210409 RepID=A0A5B7IHC3_PORTR|nr:hypothetical protein [Portunus trituberculatus]
METPHASVHAPSQSAPSSLSDKHRSTESPEPLEVVKRSATIWEVKAEAHRPVAPRCALPLDLLNQPPRDSPQRGPIRERRGKVNECQDGGGVVSLYSTGPPRKVQVNTHIATPPTICSSPLSTGFQHSTGKLSSG